MTTIDDWVIRNKLPLHVVKYKHLLKNRTRKISSILKFLHIDIADMELKEKLKKDFKY